MNEMADVFLNGVKQVTATAVSSGSITTASLAANAVTVGSQALLTAAFSTSSTSFTALTGATLTKTAGTGETWLLMVSLTADSGGAEWESELLNGSTVLFIGGDNDGTSQMQTYSYLLSPTAAAHTVSVKVLIGAGTLKIAPNDINGTDQTNASLILIQLKA